jgi:hypothetical protein
MVSSDKRKIFQGLLVGAQQTREVICTIIADHVFSEPSQI